MKLCMLHFDLNLETVASFLKVLKLDKCGYFGCLGNTISLEKFMFS